MLEHARSVCRTLVDSGYEALFAGGSVRDGLLGVPAKDIDIATSATPDEVAKLFPDCITVGAAFGVQMVVRGGHHFEIATFRTDGDYGDGRRPDSVTYTTAEEDALRRDFTVNALFQDPFSGEVLDYVNGRADLDKKIIRAVGDASKRFKEDHLRLLRAIRFSAQLDFAIEPNTYAAIKENSDLLHTISPERIRNELERIVTQPRASQAFRDLLDAGLLDAVVPELKEAVGCEQPPEFHPEGDVFVHTMLLLDQFESPTFTLAMAGLLHDIGKPRTQTFEDRIRFNQHESVGAEMAAEICQRLRISNDDREVIVWLVSQHMRIAAMPEMRESKRKRLVREPGFPELLELLRADSLACWGNLDTWNWIKDYAENLEPEAIRPEPLVNGRDLIERGHQPGPLFKEILQTIEDAQLEGELNSREDALAMLESCWPINSSE
jgi:poly(A) polymerase